MPAIAYVNGRYVRRADAVVHIEDRGNVFADAVYEAFEVHHGAIVDVRRHLDRLDRSLAELRLAAPMGRAAMVVVLKELARRNRAVNGFIYMQVSRGAAPRNHAFPVGVKPTFFATFSPSGPSEADPKYETGVSVICLPDIRWARVDIKTVGLLANSLARQAAKEQGAYEAFLYDADGLITEGSTSNAWIVTPDGVLVTRPAERGILRGITRTVVLEVARAEGVSVEERPFSVAEAKAAREVFFTSAGAILAPVVRIDDAVIGNGAPGLMTAQLRARYREFSETTPF
jgi:D-alanine transaminase